MRSRILIPILFCLGLFSCQGEQAARKPNIVIIFLDDSGWSDFEPFGEKELTTPNVTRLAEEGCSFHNFYVPQAICSASRAALLTGCYPGRTKVFGAHPPRARGLETGFATMGEVFQRAGYATAIFGKWHCGDQPETRSHSRGFNESCGLMYSNDMWRYHPENPDYWGKFQLAFWENGEITIEDVTADDQTNLTRWYTEHAVDFIERHRNEPFLLYVPHSMPHVPLFCSDDFIGKSGKGIYGDVILELDWSVGEITSTLKDNRLDKNTIVIFTSDNGPWISYGNHAGKTPFREAKGTSFDGGIRSACIIKYPLQIEPNTISTKTFFSIDILPTLCHLTGVQFPENEIDGINVWDLIRDRPEAENPHEYYAFSTGSRFEGIISGDGHWKLHLPHSYRTLVEAGSDGAPGIYRQDSVPASLFNMNEDPFETDDLMDEYPEVARKMLGYAMMHDSLFYR